MDHELLNRLLNLVSPSEMWGHIERFNKLNRVSGSLGDYEAVKYITEKLREYEIENDVICFNSYVSNPLKASLKCIDREGAEQEYVCKTRSFSASTPIEGVRGEVKYLDTSILDDLISCKCNDFKGKIAFCETGRPKDILKAQKLGAVAFIQMRQAEEEIINEMTVMPVWGTPTLNDVDYLITIPVLCIMKKDGLKIKESLCKDTLEAVVYTEVDTGWRELRMPVATIKGNKEPEKYIIIAGHLDSWCEGVTDNGTGNAAGLELARIFKQIQPELKRSVKIIWWAGHSYARYSGSTWYADNNWFDLNQNCIGLINIDSPGCRGAINYSITTASGEVEDVVKRSIFDITGQATHVQRPERAADQSFIGVGISSLHLVAGIQKNDVRLSGSGGGWWWHTEADTLDKADINVLATDTKIYAHTAFEMLQSDVLPIKFSIVADEICKTVDYYQKCAGLLFDLSDLKLKANIFKQNTLKFEKIINMGYMGNTVEINKLMLSVSRELNQFLFSSVSRFAHENFGSPTLIPGLQDTVRLKELEKNTTYFEFCKTGLLRQKNRAIHSIELCNEKLSEFVLKTKSL